MLSRRELKSIMRCAEFILSFETLEETTWTRAWKALLDAAVWVDAKLALNPPISQEENDPYWDVEAGVSRSNLQKARDVVIKEARRISETDLTFSRAWLALADAIDRVETMTETSIAEMERDSDEWSPTPREYSRHYCYPLVNP